MLFYIWLRWLVHHHSTLVTAVKNGLWRLLGRKNSTDCDWCSLEFPKPLTFITFPIFFFFFFLISEHCYFSEFSKIFRFHKFSQYGIQFFFQSYRFMLCIVRIGSVKFRLFSYVCIWDLCKSNFAFRQWALVIISTYGDNKNITPVLHMIQVQKVTKKLEFLTSLFWEWLPSSITVIIILPVLQLL
jgi:hypothetical protein